MKKNPTFWVKKKKSNIQVQDVGDLAPKQLMFKRPKVCS